MWEAFNEVGLVVVGGGGTLTAKNKNKKRFVISLLPKIYYNFSENKDRQQIDSSQKSMSCLSLFTLNG